MVNKLLLGAPKVAELLSSRYYIPQLENGQRHFVQMYNLCIREPKREKKSPGEHWEVNFMKMKLTVLGDKY